MRPTWRCPICLLAIAIAIGVACDATGPRVARLTINPDTTALVEGESVRLVASAFDENGALVPNSAITWSAETKTPYDPVPPRVEVRDGIVRFLPGATVPMITPIVTIRAQSGSVADTAAVWLQRKTDSLFLRYQATTVAPGARFDVMPVVVSPPFEIACVEYVGDVALRAGFSSSRPEVASWSRSDDICFRGWRFTAHAEGQAELSLAYGGRTARIALTVRQPTLTSMDAVQRCGLTSDGEAWCKGDNGVGQLGTLTALYVQPPYTKYQQGSAVPIRVDTPVPFVLLQTAGRSTCGLTRDQGRVFCWGLGDRGALGSAVGQENCEYIRSSTSPPPVVPTCSFVPIVVDRGLAEQLRFDSLESNAPGQRCGHVTARGPSSASMTTVDETWCWGENYGAPPQRRPAMFQ
jgi:hypothetical protein